MSEVDDAFQRRGVLGFLAMVVPIVSITIVAIAYVVMFWFGAEGREATGAVSRVTFEACADAQPLIERRLAAMGLDKLGGGSTPTGFDLVTRLPEDPHAAAFVPATLASPGRLTLRGQPGDVVLVTEADVLSSSPEMRFLDAPHARVIISPDALKRLTAWQGANPEGHLEILVEGEKIDDWKNMPPVQAAELDIDRVGGSARDRIDLSAALPIVLTNGPLPCDVKVAGVTAEPTP